MRKYRSINAGHVTATAADHLIEAESETIGDALAHGASADEWEAESPEETEARDAARLALHRDSGKPATALQRIASEPLKPTSEEAPAPVAAAGAIDITPTWGEWGRLYSAFAESGERKVCRALREDFARAMAAAEVMRELRDTFTDEQAAIVARVLCDELRKQGF